MITLNPEKIFAMELSHQKRLADFLNKFKAPANEAAELKGIPNDAWHMGMIEILRDCIQRTKGMAVRLKGRGPRKMYVDNYYSQRMLNQALPHAKAETFALYIHHDYKA